MRIAILGDIHANLEALQAVGREIESAGIDHVYTIGDIVGYNACPSKCVNIVRGWVQGAVAGNHDWGLTGRLDLNLFSPTAAEALEWSEMNTASEEVAYLEDLPVRAVFDGVTLVHSMPAQPEEFPYVFAGHDMTGQFEAVSTPVTFVGHTHHPTVFHEDGNHEEIIEGTFELPGPDKYIVNVGSVGQPRDGDPRATYAVWESDSRRLEIHRVRYDIKLAVMRIAQTGLPGSFGDRLRVGR